MKTNKYLYGKRTVPMPVPQTVIIHRKLLLTVQLKMELKKTIKERDFDRVTALQNAIKFWGEINNA